MLSSKSMKPRWSSRAMKARKERVDNDIAAALCDLGSNIETHVVDVVVVGGCSSGLMTLAQLKSEGISKAVAFETHENPGDTWRARYGRLHLHDIIEECHLPFFPMPSTYPTYPSASQFADYLENYSRSLNLDVRCSHTVLTIDEIHRVTPFEAHPSYTDSGDHGKSSSSSSLSSKPARFVVTLVNHSVPGEPRLMTFRCRHVVMASGVYGSPVVPKWPGMDRFEGRIIHTSSYTNPVDLGLDTPGSRVLVVGFGNSGCEIALDLAEHGVDTDILVRSRVPVCTRDAAGFVQKMSYSPLRHLGLIPFSWAFLPALSLAVDAFFKLDFRIRFGFTERYGVVPTWIGPATLYKFMYRPPVMDIGTVEAITRGAIKTVTSGIRRFTKKGVILCSDTDDNGKSVLEYDTIIVATGFNILDNHTKFLSEELVNRVGSGVPAVLKGSIRFAKECPRAKGIWFVFGRIQMARDAVPIIAEGIRREIADEVPSVIQKWGPLAGNIVVHAAFVAAVAYTVKRLW